MAFFGCKKKLNKINYKKIFSKRIYMAKGYRTVRVPRSRQAKNMLKIMKYKTRAYRATAKVGKNVRTYVRSMLKHYTETKHAAPLYADNVQVLPYSLVTPHSFTTLNLNQIFSNVNQGTGDGQRIGDKIKVNKLTFKGFINWDSSKLDIIGWRHLPLYVKMFVFRRQDSLENPATVTTPSLGESDILMNGAVAGAPNNLLSDMGRLFNKDVYRIFKTKTFKLGPAAVGDTPTTSGQWNNDFKFSQRFNINLSKHIDVVKYKEGSLFQQNCAFYVGFLIAFGNNSTITATQQPPVEIHYDVNMSYEDA